MNNDMRNLRNGANVGHKQGININNKIATLLAVIISFQQKIEILRVKICGHPNFSPQFYYKQIDRCEKGYIDTEDVLTFIKKSKPTYNIDFRYLKSLFQKLNQDSRVPTDRLTYFGYLNIIKPYFQYQLSRDLLLRDTVAVPNQINVVIKKLLQDLICALYVCVAEHQRVKQLIIFGDIDQGGSDPGSLYNVYELLQIIKNGAADNIPSLNTIVQNIHTAPNIRSSTNILNNINTRSDQALGQNRHTQNIEFKDLNTKRSQASISSGMYSKSNSSILTTFHKFICNFSQYEIERDQMKYLLAFLVCHQYMIIQQKYLTMLFMPVTADITIPISNRKQIQFNATNNISSQVPTGDLNFLTYVHPQSITQQQLQLQKRKLIKNKKQNEKQQQNPENKKDNWNNLSKQSSSQKMIMQEPRILINAPNQSTIQTPILQRFLRQSKVLKNMSRYQSIRQQRSEYSSSSAFVQQGEESRKKISTYKNQYLDPNIGVQHKQRPINKDFNLQDVLNNSNLHRSQYYNNLSMRAFIKDQPLKPSEIQSPSRYIYPEEAGGILNEFMLR